MNQANKPNRAKAKPNKPAKSAVSSSEMKVTTVKGKAGLHSRNVHQGRYDFPKLTACAARAETFCD